MRILKWIREFLSYNYCDTCGFTKEDVFTTELFLEAGLRQCNKCILKIKGGQDEN